MILYSLACGSGHRFESWFAGSSAYEEQASRALVSCPICQSTRVAKAIMAPSVIGGQKRDAADPVRPKEPVETAGPELGGRAMRAWLKTLRQEILADADDVGARFPEEARGIRDGDRPARQIYGQATIAEARDLLDEGILVLPLPASADDLN